MKRTLKFLAALLIRAVPLCVATRRFAQDAPSQDTPSQQAPKPAGRDYQPLGDDPNDPQSSSALTPDTAPLTGALVPGVGTQDLRHSYWVPGLQYGNQVRSTSQSQPTGSDWNSTSFVAGNVSLLEAWNNAQLTVNYSGGGTFSTDPSQGNGYYHQLALFQSFTFRRFQLSFIDNFSYLPQSQFGFGLGSGLATPGVGGSLAPAVPGVQTNYQPNQSIFSSLGSRYSNSITGQATYALSPRGSLTFTGSYGILRFVDSGNINSNDSIFSAGYNYALSKRDTLGLVDNFSHFQYLGNPQSISDNVVDLAYGRKITGRLALQIFVGPEITEFAVPLNGSSSRTSVSGGATLSYALPRTGISLGYNHGVSGGSGAFTGSNSDMFQGSVSRQLSRVWHGNVSFGYARNSSLGSGNTTLSSPTYNSFFAGAGLNRPLGRTASLSIGYAAYFEDINDAGCSTAACTNYLQHQISLSFQWHTRPLVLR